MHDSLLTEITSAIGWYCKTLGKFIRQKPWVTFAIILASMLAQGSMLIAFVLPIKVVVLLAGNNIPAWFPDILKSVDRSELVIGISLTAGLFYVINLLSLKYIARTLKGFTLYLLEKNQKLHAHTDQAVVAENAYGRCVTGLSTFFFSMLAFSIVSWLYPLIAVWFLLFITLISVIIITVCHLFSDLKERLEQNLNGVLTSLSALGFLLSFAFIVADFLLPLDPPDLLSAVIGLVLGRQIMAGLVTTILSITFLSNRRHKINGLFFRGYISGKQISKKDQHFWSLMSHENRRLWVPVVVNEIVGSEEDEYRIQWHQLGIQGVASFLLAPTDPDKTGVLLLKIYSERSTNLANHELLLLDECKLDFLAPTFLGSTIVEGFSCHLFASEVIDPVPSANFQNEKRSLQRKLIDYPLPVTLIQRYCSTHPILWERINSGMFTQLEVAADSGQMQTIRALTENLDSIRDSVSQIPLRLIVRTNTADSMLYDENGDVKMMSLGDWKIEPVGAGWRISGSDLDELSATVCGQGDFQHCTPEGIRLVALLAEIERLYLLQQYTQALELLPNIMELHRLGEENSFAEISSQFAT